MLELDILALKISELTDQNITLVGNFPYNISSQILWKILNERNQIGIVICMLQKEVAIRISSRPGNKSYGILSVLLQAYYHIKVVFFVKKRSFFPTPKVDSAVVRMVRNSKQNLGCNQEKFNILVKTAFNQRRKTLKNALKAFKLNLSVENLNILRKRAEELGVEDYVKLTNAISN